MKRITVFLFAILFFVTSCSSWRSVPDKLDDFVGDAEKSASSYTKEEWEASKVEFQALVDMFNENKDKYTDEQRSTALKAMGRYHALTVVNGFNGVASFIKSLKDALPSYLEGVEDVVNETKSGLSDAITNLLDKSNIEETVEKLGDDLEEIIDNVATQVDSLIY